QIASFGLFETGHCFRQTGGENLQETWRLGLLLTGNVHPEHFSDAPRSVDFFDLKGEIEHLLAFNAIAGKVAFERIELPWLHPGQAAALLIDGNQVGWLGQLHPGLNERLELDQPVFVAELDGERVSPRRLPEHRDSGRYPAVRRDIAIVLADEFTAASLLESIRASAGGLLEDCIVFDQYRGKGIESGFRSLAIGLILRDVSRTLKD